MSTSVLNGGIRAAISNLKLSQATMGIKKVCIIGSGNWGSAICRIIGENVSRQPKLFEKNVNMWVFEEIINGNKLTDIINSTHENVKYLPGRALPENIIAVPDINQAAANCDILVFVIPHQFLQKALLPLQNKVKKEAIGVSLIKGMEIVPSGGVELISESIKNMLNIPVSVLMGANLAHEVADGQYCETTIGINGNNPTEDGQTLRQLFMTDNFCVKVVEDANTVEVCGALKNIVACAAGFVEGLGMGDNTKAAVIRLGLMEMIHFAKQFYKGVQMETFFESCGVADLITTCAGGRNRRVSKAFVTEGKSIEELENSMLNGQKLQGPQTAAEVNFMLKKKCMEDRFPLFTMVHKICIQEKSPADIIDAVRNHPEHKIF